VRILRPNHDTEPDQAGGRFRWKRASGTSIQAVRTVSPENADITSSEFHKSEADPDRVINPSHSCRIDRAETFYDSPTIHGAYLAEMNSRWRRQSIPSGRRNRNLDRMRRNVGCDCRYDGDGTVSVPDIILDHNRWPSLLYLVSQRRVKFDQADLASSGVNYVRLDRTEFLFGVSSIA
jgi:hypothetical protein